MQVTINCDTAEDIVRVWYQDEQLGIAMLRALQEQVAHQCQQNRLFCRTVDALEDQYGRRIYAARQLLQRFENTISQINQQIHHLEEQKQSIDQQLDRYEHDLPLIQQYAHLRQLKRSKRQKQYNSFYWIPLLSARFKLKYMRARDKFAKAEHHVAQIRQAMETCHRSNRRISQSICHSREQHDQTSTHRNRIEKQLKYLDSAMAMLNEGRQFWYDFEKYQARTLMDAVNYWIQEQQDDQWITTFKMACFEYGECMQHGEDRWFTIQVEFDCALCNNVRWEWPCLDVHGLLCHACQRSIIEAQNIEKPNRLSVVSTAPSRKKRISFVSEQSIKSSSSGGRLFVKRMLRNMFGKCSPKHHYSSLVH